MQRIYCLNTKTTMDFPEGTTLLEMVPKFGVKTKYRVLSAKVNNVSQGLKYRVFNNRDVEFLDYTDPSARRVYYRSLCFLLCKAAEDAFPSCRVDIKHSISNVCYCTLEKMDGTSFSKKDLQHLRNRMKEIVKKDIPFHKYEARTEDAIEIFRKKGYDDKVRLLETIGEPYTDYYTLGGSVDYYYGRLVPSTGYLETWDIDYMEGGILLRIPKLDNFNEVCDIIRQPKTMEVLSEGLSWNKIMKLSCVGDLNHACKRGYATELIQVAEALQEKKIVQIAEEIERRHANKENPLKVVLITGPSSSGKTTVTKRLSVQLKACGIRPISFSTDDYFVNRIDTPKLPDGRYDFDNFETVDHAALERDVISILQGESVEVPQYNFVTGRREYNGRKIRMEEGSVLIVEGIHALNPNLLSRVDPKCQFKIFISTLTSIPLDYHNWIPTSDNRLLRRIIRDYNKGAFSARETISQWPYVREAENKWIYPYQESADVMFNSAYLIEFAVLRSHAEPILCSVPKDCPEYSEAHRLLRFLHYFQPVSDKDIPSTSLLRAFIGGGNL